MPFRPEELDKPQGGASWLGIKQAGVVGVLDKSDAYDWADVYLSVELDIEGSDYTQDFRLAGSFEYEPDGSLKYSPLLKRIYSFCDVIGFKGGVNMKGQWVDENDEPIDDIAGYLSAKFAQPVNNVKHNFYCFIYQKATKQGAQKPFYTEVYPKFWPLTTKGKKEADSFVVFMRKGNKLNEYTESANNYPEVQTAIKGNSQLSAGL